jgi:DNA-binding MarR family transcriptional regulator
LSRSDVVRTPAETMVSAVSEPNRASGFVDVEEFERLLRAWGVRSDASVDVEAISLVLLLSRLSSQVLNELDTRVHRPRGWSWSGFRIMLAVLVMGPLEPRQVAPLAGVSRASISAVLNTLERDGLVERRRDSADRRVVTIVLTERGQDQVLTTYAEQHLVEREWARTLSRDEIQQFTGLLRKMLASRGEPVGDPSD